MSAILPPSELKGRRLSIIDVLLFVYDQLRRGVMLEMFIGTVDVHAMVAFVEGINWANYCAGYGDNEFQAFLAWLRDIRREWPAGGWWKKYLEDSQGDHRAAIMKFLSRVEEFRKLGSFQGDALEIEP